MNEVQEKIMANIDAAGGSCDWDTAIAGLSYPERQGALVQVRAMKRQGLINRVVAVNPETGLPELTISKVVA